MTTGAEAQPEKQERRNKARSAGRKGFWLKLEGSWDED